MLTAVTSMEVLEEADELARMILSSDLFQAYKESKHKLQTDEHAQQLVARFIKMKESYEEVQRFGKYHPDYDRVSKEIRVLKRELDMHDSVAEYKRLEKELETLLNEVSAHVARAVSESIKVPTGNPFFDNLSCSGGCGSGAGCSCG
ncbi:YlbF family regulator [Desertibacillus haloalkaliphilus]|uniref:YlbF family regulator n=1 Tax=Desertibacillus haloalkaliphilus TaxID=1328930 RepID=UPI001C261870|nr:YlbF family regulator [Desertibacillus haloalkaliphilus]MBU8907138.1 YlbF family regulator [Desertibacillus haloalkaliphilus]